MLGCSGKVRGVRGWWSSGGARWAAAESRFDPGRQGTRPEGLGHEIIRSEVEHPDLSVLVSLRGQHHDRDITSRRTGPELRQNTIAVESGEVEIEDDHIGR